MKNKIKKWIINNRSEFLILLLILLVGAFCRLYKIADYMTFLGDEGRDAIIVRRFLVNFDLMLIGPGTSIGNMYLGPLYYYLSAPFLLLANFSPVGPSVMVALFGVATIFLVWYSGRIWFGKYGALVAGVLYALSPVIIIYNRSSWNPNIMPFFAMLTMFSLWKVWAEGKMRWFLVMGLSLAFVLQSHYLGLLLLPVILVFVISKLYQIRTLENTENKPSEKSGREKKDFFKYLISGVFFFLFLMSPLLLFDIRHNFVNFNAIMTFFTKRETTVSVKPWKSIPNIFPIVRDSISHRIVSGQNIMTGKISVAILIFSFLTFLILNILKIKKLLFSTDKKEIFNKGMLLLLVWITVGLVGLGLYKQHVYDHYFGFLFPAVFLFIGGIYQKIIDMHFDGLKIVVTSWIIIILGSYIVKSPLRGLPNYQMYRAKEVAKLIRSDISDYKFNLAVIAQQNYEDGYQYFLEKDGANVVDIDAQRLKETVGEYLYVVCEMPEEMCDPTHSPKAEVANFGWSKIENKWKILGVVIYKLSHAV